MTPMTVFKRFASSKATRVLKRPVFDYKYLVENEAAFVESITRREVGSATLDNYRQIRPLYRQFVDQDKAVRDLKFKRRQIEDELKNKGNKALLPELREIKVDLKTLSDNLDSVKDQLYSVAESIPNLVEKSVPDQEVIVDHINFKEIVPREDPIYDHKAIGEKLGIMDFKKASQVSGTSWYYLLGDGALLEQALVQYALKLARQAGFKMCIPPSIVRSEITDSCGFKPRDQNGEQQVYELQNDQLCLTGTAEIPIAAFHANDVFGDLSSPERLVGVSRSYRAEAGARGRDTKGLYRVHEFTKVELFVFSENDEAVSSKELQKLVDFQTKFVSSLGLTAKVMNMPANDLGASAYQKYDIEAYMPGRGKFGELSSSSNCLDYQSRRLNIRYKTPQGDLKYAHTLNGTAVAVPRCIVALIENFYDPTTETIEIPEVLRVYMDGKDRIAKQ